MRTQISTNVSNKTREQADELMGRYGYSLRDVITIAIDRLYKQEIPPMWQARVEDSDNNGKEFGYGKYINAIVYFGNTPAGEIVDSICLPFDASDNGIDAAKNRMLKVAEQVAKSRN